MGKRIFENIKKKEVGSIGIGAMIVFIAMVLVAGIAASVLIQTSTTLESQALATGQETTAEVSSGLEVVSVEGYNTSGSGSITRLVIVVTPRAGSSDIDLGQTVIEISDSATKNFLVMDTSKYTGTSSINGDLFTESFFTSGATNFSVIVLSDPDGSCSSGTSAVINSGDYIALGVNTTACFSGLSARDNVWGLVMPEEGAPGVINFKCPSSFTDAVIELQ